MSQGVVADPGGRLHHQVGADAATVVNTVAAECDAPRGFQSGCDEVFGTRAVEVGALDLACFRVRPVDLPPATSNAMSTLDSLSPVTRSWIPEPSRLARWIRPATKSAQ